MITSRVKYLGGLRTEATHQKSNNQFITDAPTDNHGKGEAFSPTDTVATSLATCMLTVMGIKAQSLGFDLEDASAEVTKVMASSPRRISEVKIKLTLGGQYDARTIEVLEKTGRACPVANSLHPDLIQTIEFTWQ